MKHTCQKLLAGFLAVSVMISLCVISAFADDTASPTLDAGAAPSPQAGERSWRGLRDNGLNPWHGSVLSSRPRAVVL